MKISATPISVEIHYGGKFIWEPSIKYVGDKVECLVDRDREILCISYFEDIYHTLFQQNGPCLIYYRLPGVSLDMGLCALNNDMDVLAMVEIYEELNVLCMYMVQEEHSDEIEDIVAVKEFQQLEEINGDAISEVQEQIEEVVEEEDKEVSEENDIFRTENIVTEIIGPIGNIDDWWSEVEDIEYAEKLKSLSGSEDGTNYDEFNELTGMKNPNLFVGLKFSTPQIFRKAMVRWNVIRGHDIKYLRNENKRITAKCKHNCGWRIHASPIGDTSTFQIKTFISEHSCGQRHDNRLVDSRYLAEEYLDDLRENDEMKVKTLKRKARMDLNVEISKWQCYRAKKKVEKIVEGDIKKQFALLRDYCLTVMHHNPGSSFKIQIADHNVEINGEQRFLRLYARLGAQKDGYLAALRPIVGLDGCFLKGPIGGQLLSAICRDGNENLFPLAIAIVESECKDTWTWFLSELLNDLGDVQERGWVFISDRQKGLVETINQLMPGVEHRFCLRHMYANFKQKYKGKELKDLFWKAASTSNLNDWNYFMEDIKKADPPKIVDGEEGECAFKWLMNVNPSNWARSHFSTRAKCDILVNNMNESWNNYIIDARDMHIISMLEWIRKKLMVRFQVKRAGMLKHDGKICPNIFKKLEKIKTASANCFPTWSGGMIFEVECYEGLHVRKCSVNFEAGTCTCRMWEVSGIPCKHAVSAIFLNKHQPEDYVHPCFSREAYLATYNFQIFPVPGEHDYLPSGLPLLLPPIRKKQPGRPKKKRNKTVDELPLSKGNVVPTKVSRKKLSVKCSRCLQTGHTKRKCKGEMHPNSKLLKQKKARQSQRNSIPIKLAVSTTQNNSVPFQNPFVPQLTSQASILVGPNGAMFQRSNTTAIQRPSIHQTRKGKEKMLQPEWRI